MKIDFNKKMVDYEGTVYTRPKNSVTANGESFVEQTPMTMAYVTIESLKIVKEASENERVDLYDIAVKIKNPESDFSSEEIALMKKFIKKNIFSTDLVGQCLEILEGKPVSIGEIIQLVGKKKPS